MKTAVEQDVKTQVLAGMAGMAGMADMTGVANIAGMANMTGMIGAPRSTTHKAVSSHRIRTHAVDLVLALLNASTTGKRADRLRHLLQSPTTSDAWPDVIAFASAHSVIQALAEPLRAAPPLPTIPNDVREFFNAIYEENQARNAMLRDALEAIAEHFNVSDVQPVVLKGAALLVDNPDAPAPAWRFMNDIDLLVPATMLQSCVRVIKSLGYVAGSENYDARKAHYPPFTSPCGRFSVELHTRLFDLHDFGLPTVDIWREATPRTLGTATVMRPCWQHRVAHTLLHAQLHNRNVATQRLVLKDVTDLKYLDCGKKRWAGLLAHAASQTPDTYHAMKSLLSAYNAVFPDQLDGSEHKPDVWARRAVQRLYWGRLQHNLALPWDLLRLEGFRICRERGHGLRRLQLIGSPARLREAADVWRLKHRQRTWGSAVRG